MVLKFLEPCFWILASQILQTLNCLDVGFIQSAVTLFLRPISLGSQLKRFREELTVTCMFLRQLGNR